MLLIDSLGAMLAWWGKQFHEPKCGSGHVCRVMAWTRHQGLVPYIGFEKVRGDLTRDVSYSDYLLFYHHFVLLVSFGHLSPYSRMDDQDIFFEHIIIFSLADSVGKSEALFGSSKGKKCGDFSCSGLNWFKVEIYLLTSTILVTWLYNLPLTAKLSTAINLIIKLRWFTVTIQLFNCYLKSTLLAK